MNLIGAYNKLSSTLKRQVQGTCGLYTFWYATLILQELQKHAVKPSGSTINKPPDVFPRRREGVSSKHPMSLRCYAKSKLHSGQGEVNSKEEIEKIINHYGYKFESSKVQDDISRKIFISSSISNKRPVLCAFLSQGPSNPPLTPPDPSDLTKKPSGNVGEHYGAHVCLIVGVTTKNYRCIDPNEPTNLKDWDRKKLLKSNSYADAFPYPRYWGKTGGGVTEPRTDPKITQSGLSGTYKYDINDPNRKAKNQCLNNVLVAVYT